MLLTRRANAEIAIVPLVVGLMVFAIAEARPGGKTKNLKDGLVYALIPAGSFQMGCSRDDCPQNEHPVHKVAISRGFWIGTTEVTVGAYKRFVQATGRSLPPDTMGGYTVNAGWKNDRMPIVNVMWNEAAEYCKWAGGALPTEAQWEYAARGGSSSDPYGPLDEIAWTASNSGREHLDADSLFQNDKAHYEETLKKNGNGPHEVGLKRPNAFGLYDMIGNVAEWTNDWTDRLYYSHSPDVDPSGPPAGEAKISRGGHFLYQNHSSRASKRLAAGPQERSPIGGFRSVLGDLQ